MDVDSREAIAAVIASLGGNAAEYSNFAEGPARQEHDRVITEAEQMGVFGVPTFVLDGELFWGSDRISLLCERLEERQGATTRP